MNVSPGFLHGLATELGHRLDAPTRARFEAAVHGAASALGVTADELEARFAAAEPAAVSALTGRLSVNETWFFRSPEHFEALERLAAAASASGRPFSSAWSAGCATGEEAWSLGIALSPHCPGLRVVGTDISPAALEIAREAIYGPRSFRDRAAVTLPDLLPLEAGRWQLSPRLRDRVHFATSNLAGPALAPPTALPPLVDVVMCRNVLIYLQAELVTRVVQGLCHVLAEGGVLLLGPLEADASMLPKGFRRLPVESAFVIQRERAAAPSAPRPAPRPSRPAQTSSLKAQARALADASQWDEALAALRALPESTDTLFLEGTIHTERGEHQLARLAFQSVLSLAPAHVPALFNLMLLYERDGRASDADQMRAKLLAALDAAPPDEDFGLPGYVQMVKAMVSWAPGGGSR